MAVVFEAGLKQSLKADGTLPVYILFGEDAFLKQKYLNKISLSVAEAEDVFNYCKFTEGCDLQEVYDAVMQMPLMNDKKCVILNDFDYLHCSPSDLERLTELIKETPKETVFILYFDGIETDHKKGAKFKKLILACEKAGGLAVLLNHPTRAELVKMLSEGARKRGCKMDSQVSGYLVDTCGEDINLLRNELEKLCAFTREGQVTKDHIEQVCTKTLEANVFGLSDLILNCKSTEALKLLGNMFFVRMEPMAIFYTVSGVYNDMFRVFSAKAQGVAVSEVAKTFGYGNRAFLLEKASRNLSKFDFKKLSLSLDTLVETDKKLKSFGLNPKTVLEEMVVKLIYIIAKGESLD